MLNHEPYYYGNIRKYTAAFGSLFNSISVIRDDEDGSEPDIREVPLAYMTRKQFFQRLKQNDPADEGIITIKKTLPRMTFAINSLEFDEDRKISSLASITCPNDEGNPTKQYAPVPYNFGFELSAISNNITDILQIAEQILPIFPRTYTLGIKDNPLNSEDVSDIPFILNSVNIDEQILGEFSTDNRYYFLDINFTVQGNLFGPLSPSGGVIKEVTVNTKESIELDTALQQYIAEVVPREANEDDPHIVVETFLPC